MREYQFQFRVLSYNLDKTTIFYSYTTPLRQSHKNHNQLPLRHQNELDLPVFFLYSLLFDLPMPDMKHNCDLSAG